MHRMRVLLSAALTASTLLMPAQQAVARAFFSFGFGFPLGYPYPYYHPYGYSYSYPPPAYYYPPASPPAYYYVPPAYAPPPAGLRCHAGDYACPVEGVGQTGDACSCPTSRGRAWGRIGAY